MTDPNTLRARLSNILGSEIPAFPKNADLETVSKVIDSLEALGVSANAADALGLRDIAKAMDARAGEGIALLVCYFASLESEVVPKGDPTLN